MKKLRNSTGASAPGESPLRLQAGDIMMYLRQAQSAAVVSVAALKHQNCELDEDIANVLQRGVIDVIHVQLERLESIDRATQSQHRTGNVRPIRGRVGFKGAHVR